MSHETSSSLKQERRRNNTAAKRQTQQRKHRPGRRARCAARATNRGMSNATAPGPGGRNVREGTPRGDLIGRLHGEVVDRVGGQRVYRRRLGASRRRGERQLNGRRGVAPPFLGRRKLIRIFDG